MNEAVRKEEVHRYIKQRLSDYARDGNESLLEECLRLGADPQLVDEARRLRKEYDQQLREEREAFAAFAEPAEGSLFFPEPQPRIGAEEEAQPIAKEAAKVVAGAAALKIAEGTQAAPVAEPSTTDWVAKEKAKLNAAVAAETKEDERLEKIVEERVEAREEKLGLAIPGVQFGEEPDRSGDQGAIVLSQGSPYDNAKEWARRRGFRQGQLATFFHGGEFWQWNGQCYVALGADKLRATVWEFLNEARRHGVDGDGGVKLIAFTPKPEHVNGLIDGLKAGLRLEMPPGRWLDTGEAAEEVIAFANGLVEIMTGKLREATPRLWVQDGLAFDYVPEAQCPRWVQFLEEILPGDKEAQDCLEEQLGYGMTDDYTIQKGAMWIGDSRGGKGTVAWVQRQLVGEKYFAGLSFNTWVRGENSSQPLIGKKVLCFPDVRLRPPKWYGEKTRDRGGLDHVSQEQLLKITGRDPLTIAQKWEKGWEGQVRGKVILISNHPPDLGDPILPTRFNKIRFKQSFLGREDNDLQEKKLRPELPGIAVRCLAAYRRLKERGRFIQPKSAVWLEEEVSVNSNPFAAFVARNVVKEDGADALCKSVYERFEAWCRENGQIDTLKSTPRNHLTRRLNGEGGLTGLNIRRPNGEPRRYVGIRLRTMKELREIADADD